MEEFNSKLVKFVGDIDENTVRVAYMFIPRHESTPINFSAMFQIYNELSMYFETLDMSDIDVISASEDRIAYTSFIFNVKANDWNDNKHHFTL